MSESRAELTSELSAVSQNIQTFDSPPSLAELQALLGVICEELPRYNVWPVRAPPPYVHELDIDLLCRRIAGSSAH